MKKTPNDHFFEKLYIEMRSKLLRFAMAKIPDKTNAEDIVEEAFRTAWQKIDELVTSENPHGWLFNTLKLHILKYYDKQAKEHADKRDYSDTDVPSETVFDNEISFEGNLTDNEMQIIKLKEAGYKHEEISAIMDLPAGTIHSKVSRIKDKLKKFLANEK